MARILVVEDDRGQQAFLTMLVEQHGHVCVSASDVPEARSRLHESTFDLILVDISLPGDSGIDLLREVSERLPDVGVVMVTGMDSEEMAKRAIDFGAVGYVVKPYTQNEIAIAIHNALRRCHLEKERRRSLEELEIKVVDRTASLRDALALLEQKETASSASESTIVEKLAKALTLRDEETGEHIERVSRYCELLAKAQGFDTKSADEIRLASTLHDVGKIGTPDNILLKPGPLSPDEREIVERHAQMGYRLLTGSPSKILALGATIALTHHERWDGNGYPSGLAQDSIPIEGRIAGVADVFDALTNDRVYRPAYSLEDSVRMMKEERAAHFDPFLVDVLLDSIDDVLEIRTQFRQPQLVDARQ
jgi:putative two-component system response regulator